MEGWGAAILSRNDAPGKVSFEQELKAAGECLGRTEQGQRWESLRAGGGAVLAWLEGESGGKGEGG